MKFEITKEHLVNALSKMCDVGTKGIKADFEKAYRVTIRPEDNKVVFLTSNGLLDARWEVTKETDNNFKCSTKGEATIDVTVAKKIAEAIGGNKKDNVVSVYLEDNNGSSSLFMKDVCSKAKKIANMVTIPEHHTLAMSKPKTGFKYEFKTEHFTTGVRTSAKYVARDNYMPRFRMICLHFFKQETRFICGDGSRFGILTFALDKDNAEISDDAGQKFLMPCDQAQIISSVCSEASDIEIVYKDEMTCYIQPLNGSDAAMTLVLKGIPKDNYISYDKHAFNFSKAVTVVDLNKEAFLEGMQLIGAVKDKEQMSGDGFHACDLVVKDSRVEFLVDESRYAADYDMEASVYGEQTFSSCYAHDYLSDMAECSNLPMIRLYCSDPKGAMIAEPVDPDADGTKNEMGVPVNKPCSPKLSFFFSAAVEAED